MTSEGLSRRQLLAGGAALGSAAVSDAVHPATARTIQGEMPWQPGQSDAPRPVEAGSYQFFTPEEAAFIEAAVSRLIPADDLGPGARETGVPVFLDRQLAGSYGRAERWYMLGPWRNGAETQGYQSRLTPAQMYHFAIGAIDAFVRDRHAGQVFAQLAPDDQDQL